MNVDPTHWRQRTTQAKFVCILEFSLHVTQKEESDYVELLGQSGNLFCESTELSIKLLLGKPNGI